MFIYWLLRQAVGPEPAGRQLQTAREPSGRAVSSALSQTERLKPPVSRVLRMVQLESESSEGPTRWLSLHHGRGPAPFGSGPRVSSKKRVGLA